MTIGHQEEGMKLSSHNAMHVSHRATYSAEGLQLKVQLLSSSHGVHQVLKGYESGNVETIGIYHLFI